MGQVGACANLPRTGSILNFHYVLTNKLVFSFKIMRHYKRKTQRGTTASHIMLAAAKEVKLNYKSIRGAAKDYGTPETSLRRFLGKPEVTPLQLKPLPKAGPRKGKKLGRRKRHTAILTDTPIKEALREEQTPKKKVVSRKKAFNNDKEHKQKAPPRKKAKIADYSSDDEPDCLCLYYLDTIGNSASRETWIKRASCSSWAHAACAGDIKSIFICINCLTK